jgi:hypothetical protein
MRMAQKRKRSELRDQAEDARSGEGRAYEADMRVLLFGAGSSMRAGYPLASELISATEEFVHSEREVMRRTYWNRWDSWRRNAEGIVKELLYSSNPEVVLSVPDLYEAALQAGDIEQWTKALKKWKAEGLTEEELREHQDHWRSQERKKLSEAHLAPRGRWRPC